ncbi:MAG: hypothetical protein HW406_2097 [Candidatus Brocadiaceae bacterium]|nr:hypothetical protein [Candidatus Brocadiaceae bacterium]
MNIPNISHPALRILVEHEPHLFLDENGTPDIKNITEKLALELKSRLKGFRVSLSDIEGVKSRFVLLIGSDDDLLDSVGAYIYCLRSVDGCTSLYYQSFRGKPDDYLENELPTKYIFKNDTTIRQYEAIADKKGSGTRVSTTGLSTGYPRTMDGDLLDHVRQGRSVFLSDLKYPNNSLLESVGKKIKSIETDWEMNTLCKPGLLIVSAESEKDLPAYFVKQFEVIDFNPKQAQPAGQATPEARNTVSTPQTPTGATGNKPHAKLLRGKKQPYADRGDFGTFLSNIKTKFKNLPLEKMARMVEGEMKLRNFFLNNKGEPIYKRSTIKKMLSAIKNHHKK